MVYILRRRLRITLYVSGIGLEMFCERTGRFLRSYRSFIVLALLDYFFFFSFKIYSGCPPSRQVRKLLHIAGQVK